MPVLIDTILLVEAVGQRFDLGTWAESIPDLEVWICDAALAEFLADRPVKDTGRTKRVVRFYQNVVQAITSLSLTRRVCEEAGRLLGAAKGKGFTDSLGDGLHGAVAGLSGLQLATVDTDHCDQLGARSFNP